jgi:LPS sulfotransferase NodH
MKIVVLANYRTGSTAFCHLLSRMYRIPNFSELLQRDKTQDDYNKVNFDQYVIKIMPDQVFEPIFSELIKSSVVYGLYRRDMVQQITSYFVASQRNVWQNYDYADRESYSIDYNIEQLTAVVNRIVNLNKDYEEKMKPLCVKEYVYEDIQPLLQASAFKRYNKPTNYEDLFTTVKKLVNNNL